MFKEMYKNFIVTKFFETVTLMGIGKSFRPFREVPDVPRCANAVTGTSSQPTCAMTISTMPIAGRIQEGTTVMSCIIPAILGIWNSRL